jgi:hypothetical protein
MPRRQTTRRLTNAQQLELNQALDLLHYAIKMSRAQQQGLHRFLNRVRSVEGLRALPQILAEVYDDGIEHHEDNYDLVHRYEDNPMVAQLLQEYARVLAEIDEIWTAFRNQRPNLFVVPNNNVAPAVQNTGQQSRRRKTRRNRKH